MGDGNLSMPLCEEKLIATLVLFVPVLAATVSASKAAGLAMMVTTAEDSLDVSAAKNSMFSSRRRLSRQDGPEDGFAARFGRIVPASTPGNDPAAHSPESVPSVDLRTLVVEDNDLNLAVITKFLEMSGVTRIDTASDGPPVPKRCWQTPTTLC